MAKGAFAAGAFTGKRRAWRRSGLRRSGLRRKRKHPWESSLGKRVKICEFTEKWVSLSIQKFIDFSHTFHFMSTTLFSF
jgi:hypothetical protein